MGVAISPLCNRERDVDLAKSQIGFFQFICVPFFHAVADLTDPQMYPYRQLKANLETWKEQQQSTSSDGQPAPPAPAASADALEA